MQKKHKYSIIIILFVIANSILNTNIMLSQIIHTEVSSTVDANYYYGNYVVYESALDLDKGLVKLAEIRLYETLTQYEHSAANDLATLIKSNIDLQNGNYHIAVKRLELFIRERNNSPFVSSAYLFNGYIHLEAGDYEKAEKCFNAAHISADNDKKVRSDKEHYANIDHAATYWLAISLSHQGKYLEAIPFFDSTYKNYPDKLYAAQSIYALATIAEMDKDYNKAIKYYELLQNDYKYSNVIIASLIRNANDDLLVRNPQSALLNIQKAENAYQHIVAKDSIGLLYSKQDFNEKYNENVLYLKGEALNQVKNYDQAILTFSELINTYPNTNLIDLANMGLSWAHLNKSEFPEAIKYCQAVIDSKTIDNSNVKALAHLNKVTAFKKLGKTDEAQIELSTISILPNFPLISYVQLELGQIYYEKGDYDLARRTLERAEREADNPKIQIRIAALLASSYLELKQYQKAVISYRRTEQLAESSSEILIPNKKWYLYEARFKQGIALVLNQRSAEAIPPLLKYIADNTENPNLDEALFWLAEAYYRTDMLRNASETFDKIVQTYSKTNRREETLYGLGWSYFRLEKFDKSSATFDQLVKEFPKSQYATEVLTRQADGYYRIKNYPKAAEYYSRAAKIGPNTEEGQYSAYQLAHTLYRQNKFEQAITASLSFVKNYSKSATAPNALYLIAWIRFQQERYSESIENFHFLISTYPKCQLIPRAYFAIADAYYNMGNYEQAIEGYKVVVEQFPSDELAPEAMKSIQYALIALDRDAEAIGIADSYINNNPNSPFIEDFKYKKAEMFYTGRRYPDAISEYETFTNAYPESEKTAEALYWLGKSYAAMNDFENSAKSFLKLYKQFPKNDYSAVGLLEYGLLLKSQNMVDSANAILQIIEANFAKSESAPQAGFERAILFFGKNDTLSAINQFRSVADKYPETVYGDQSRYRVGMYYRIKGENETAIKEFEKVAEIYDNPTIAAEARYRIGELYLKMGDRTNAQNSFEIIKDKFSGYEDWFSLGMLGLGEIYEKQENKEEAIEIYRTIQQLRPTDEFGKTATQRLKRLK